MYSGEEKLKKEIDRNTLVIIPCYNEETTIGSVILKTKRYVDNILVVDDGSTDETAKVAGDGGAIVISHKMNYGKSRAIKTGFKYALAKDFDYVISLDGDGQHNPNEIPSILGSIFNNGYDIAIGVRSGNGTEMPIWRKFGKRILDYATSFGSGGHVTDSQCGFRAFNKKAIKALTPRLNGEQFTVESEALIMANELGLEVTHTNVTCKYKNLDTSTKDPTSHGFSVLSHIIWLVAERRPLLFIGVPGFVMVILGLFFGILTLQHYNQTRIFLLPYAILVSIFLIIGVLAMFIGLMLNVLPRIIKQNQEKETY